MSITKNYKEGNKGSDFNYRSRILKGLQNVSDNTQLLGTLVTVMQRTLTSTASPGVLDITNTVGSTLNTWKSFTVVCVAGTVDIGTETFPVGTYSFSNGNGTLTSIAYDASSSTDCKIIFVA
jgi:hypothetical protein